MCSRVTLDCVVLCSVTLTAAAIKDGCHRPNGIIYDLHLIAMDAKAER